MQDYGADKVWKQLNREGIAVARCTVERLMKRKPSINDTLPLKSRRSEAKCPRGHMHSDGTVTLQRWSGKIE